VDLRPGDYQVEVAASLDGENWTADSERFTFTVLRPWFLQPWAWVLLAAAAAGLLYAVHRLRVVHLVRLERQRTRIAMDLHDEMGSGLGSIGILAGLAADDAVPPASRGEMARKIAVSAAELGGSLQDIIWSLGSDAARLGELAARLAERGEQLFAADGDRFRTDFPEAWPARGLSLPVRRNAFLVGLEALHNASRHAGADRVVLGLAPTGTLWRLWVEDNGRGIDTEGRTEGEGTGLGLTAMRRRADQIGAELTVTSGPEQGTRVELHFDLRAEDRRIRGRLRS
jgi:signal transduction histidine kinase